ncbi:MAG: TA system VapC family ribonuclease toxin [Xanthobacteraceae bacterium]
MILVDVNLLIYATFENMKQHRAARAWLESQFNGSTRVGLPWACLLGYLRIATNQRAFSGAIKIDDAWDQMKGWLACDPVWIPQPTERHAEVLGTLLSQPGVHGDLVPDAHLAALAIEHGLTLCSTDGDFARFRELKWLNPLAS